MFAVNVSADVKKLQRQLDDLARKQLPFATAKALTATARTVQAAEQKSILGAFPSATPFTAKSVAVKGATKASQTATVTLKDIAASYLMPYEFGGSHSLGGKQGLLVPKNQRVNQYGNLPKGALARLKGQSNVFVGSITFKNSGQTVSGVWQRPPTGKRRSKGAAKGGYGTVTNARLKLLIRFEDPLPVKQHLGWRETAARVVGRTFDAEMRKALAQAFATAKG